MLDYICSSKFLMLKSDGTKECIAENWIYLWLIGYFQCISQVSAVNLLLQLGCAPDHVPLAWHCRVVAPVSR